MVLAELKVDNIYIVCGYTDMRKSIAGLSAIIIQQFQMRPDEHSMFLFCGKRADRMKALIWEGDGFLMLYKVLMPVKSVLSRTDLSAIICGDVL